MLGGAEPTGGLAIVVGAHSNMPPPSLTGKAVDAPEEALESQAYLAVVVADGEPFLMDGAGVLVARDNNQVQKQDRERNRQAIDAMLAEAEAKTPETDFSRRSTWRTGICSAPVTTRSSSSTPASPPAGALDFAAEPYLLDQDPDELASSLAEAGALPDLSGIRVVFQGLGDTAAPQPALGQRQRDNLVAIWEAVLRRRRRRTSCRGDSAQWQAGHGACPA